MGVDGKYGRVTTEFGDIGDDEPVVVFRAKDALLPEVLAIYGALCTLHGSPDRHVELVRDSKARVERWQAANTAQVPSSSGYVPREGD